DLSQYEGTCPERSPWHWPCTPGTARHRDEPHVGEPDHATLGTVVWAHQTAVPARRPERQTMKKQKIKFSEQQELDTCVRQLEALLEGLKSGTLSLSQCGQKLWLRPGGAVDIELR